MRSYLDLISKPLELIGLLLIILGVAILVIGLVIAYTPELRRLYNQIPDDFKPLILISVRIGSVDIMISPILIAVLTILYLILLYKL